MARIFNPATLLAGLLLSTSAVAINKDFEQPIKIASKYQSADGINKLSIFRENVRISQGSMSINADELQVDAGQGEGREVFIAMGQPASYEQTMEDGSRIRAEANHIEYRVNERTLTLSGDAQLQQNNSKVSGESILFNMEKEQLIAQGSDDGEGRVVTIFQPEPKKGPSEEKKQEKKP